MDITKEELKALETLGFEAHPWDLPFKAASQETENGFFHEIVKLDKSWGFTPAFDLNEMASFKTFEGLLEGLKFRKELGLI